MSYPKIIKEAALERMFHTDLSLRHIADELGIPRATLHGWKRKYQMIKSDNETVNTPAESWTPEEKFAVVLESATLSEVELNAYCREKGLYPGQIKSCGKPAFAVTNLRINTCIVRQAIDSTNAKLIPWNVT